MNKIVLLGSTALVGLTLAGCGQQTKQTTTTHQTKSEKINKSSSSKHHTKARKDDLSAKSSSSVEKTISAKPKPTEAISEPAKKTVSNNKSIVNANSQSQKANIKQAKSSDQAVKSQATPNNTTKPLNNKAQTGEPQDLHQFLAKYGMTPAAYKVQHEGMSELEALESTPISMKTSGENQYQYQLEQPKGQHQNPPANQDVEPEDEPEE